MTGLSPRVEVCEGQGVGPCSGPPLYRSPVSCGCCGPPRGTHEGAARQDGRREGGRPSGARRGPRRNGACGRRLGGVEVLVEIEAGPGYLDDGTQF